MGSSLKETRDETLIDEEWLKSIGFEFHEDGWKNPIWLVHNDDSFPLFIRKNHYCWTIMICSDLKYQWPVDICCRFQVIDLLRCLERGPAYDEPCGSGKEGE